MKILDIIGPVMIGPSSSHTAGAARLGKMARLILGEPVARANMKLHGSFRDTYRGHGTDRAIVAGLLGYEADDDRLRDSFHYAQEAGMVFSFSPVTLRNAHPNTVVFELLGISGKEVNVVGCSIGGGAIEITEIGNYQVQLDGTYPSIIVICSDVPGILAKVASVFSIYAINIALMKQSRQGKGAAGEDMMIFETDQQLPDDLCSVINRIEGVKKSFILPSL